MRLSGIDLEHVESSIKTELRRCFKQIQTGMDRDCQDKKRFEISNFRLVSDGFYPAHPAHPC
jgi:hypothetical protein